MFSLYAFPALRLKMIDDQNSLVGGLPFAAAFAVQAGLSSAPLVFVGPPLLPGGALVP